MRRFIGSLIGIGLILYGSFTLLSHFLFGHPKDEQFVRQVAATYLEDHHRDQSLEITSATRMMWGSDLYLLTIDSDTSIDTHFELHITADGDITFNDYANVTSGMNTFDRIHDAYRQLVGPALPEHVHLSDDVLIPKDGPDSPEESLDSQSLRLDQDYDIQDIGANHGSLFISVDAPVVTVNRAAFLLRDLKHNMDAAGVPFRTMSVTLRGEEDWFYTGSVSREAIDSPELEQIIQRQHDEVMSQ